jgi:hypothetical protein
LSNDFNGVPADSIPVLRPKTEANARDFVTFVCLPDQIGGFRLEDRAVLETRAAAFVEEAGIADPIELASDRIEQAVRSYLHYGDAEIAVDAIADLGFAILSEERGDASFADIEFSIVAYDPTSGDMTVTDYPDEAAFDEAVETLSVHCEAYRSLGLPIPAPKYRPPARETLH